MKSPRIMLVDDDKHLCMSLGPHLSDLGYEVCVAASAESALSQFSDFKPDIVFTDVQMPGMNGFQLLARLREAQPDLDVVIITGYGGVQGAIDAIRDGASDYLLKPLDLDEIESVVERCMGNQRDRGGADLGQDEASMPAPGGLVGRHPSMLSVYKTIGAVAVTRASVLIRGETGTGKEIIARTIHGNSSEADHPFIAVNCASVPDTLLESSLFGHVRGSFTGASADRRGPFELAGQGTIFLDEIGDTGLALQAKLLRVLEEREFYPVGSEQPRRTEARVLAATNKDLEEAVGSGEFREDLFFRLKVIEIQVPPLRDRRSDIPLLVRHILAKASAELGRQVPPGVSSEVMANLLSRDWPGNVRELENVLTRAMVMSRGPTLSLLDIEGEPWGFGANQSGGTERTSNGTHQGHPSPDQESLSSVERRHVQRVLTMTKGNKSAAARILEVSRPTLNRMIKDYEIVVP